MSQKDPTPAVEEMRPQYGMTILSNGQVLAGDTSHMSPVPTELLLALSAVLNRRRSQVDLERQATPKEGAESESLDDDELAEESSDGEKTLRLGESPAKPGQPALSSKAASSSQAEKRQGESGTSQDPEPEKEPAAKKKRSNTKEKRKAKKSGKKP